MNIFGISSGFDTSKIIEALSKNSQQRINLIENSNHNLTIKNDELRKLSDSFSDLSKYSRNVLTNLTGENVQEFINAFNETLQLSEQQTRVEIGNNIILSSGTFQGDVVIGRIPMNLKSFILREYDETNLSEIGIKLNRNRVDFDIEKFEKALLEDPDKVKKVFNGSVSNDGFNGFARNINNYSNSLTNFDGYLTRQEKNNTRRIFSNFKRISKIESDWKQQEISLINQFARMEEVMATMQNQFAMIESFLK